MTALDWSINPRRENVNIWLFTVQMASDDNSDAGLEKMYQDLYNALAPLRAEYAAIGGPFITNIRKDISK